MKTRIFLSMALIAFLGLSNPSFAQSKFDKTHPRRSEVNTRLNKQNARIKNKVADGKMSKSEASKLHAHDHQVRQEERDMAAQNHGHITKQEDKTLNQQENKNSHKIKNH